MTVGCVIEIDLTSFNIMIVRNGSQILFAYAVLYFNHTVLCNHS